MSTRLKTGYNNTNSVDELLNLQKLEGGQARRAHRQVWFGSSGMKKMRKCRQGFAVKPIPFFIGILGATVAASTANAQVTHNITLGNPKALALGNAVTADPPGIDSIHFNPAGLAKIKGRERQFKFLVAHMTLEGEFGRQEADDLRDAYNEFQDAADAQDHVWDSTDTDPCYVAVGGVQADPTQEHCFKSDPVQNTSSSTSDAALILPGMGVKSVPIMAVPFGGVAVEDPDYGWTFATAFYSPQAVGYERDENDPAAFQGYKVATARLTYFSPSVGLQINDEISVGASIGFSWQGFGVHTKFRAPEQTLQFLSGTVDRLDPNIQELLGLSLIGPYDNVGNLELELEDPLSLSFNLGMLWEPQEWISFGFVYQSESTSDLEGSYKMTNTDEFLATTQSLNASPIGGLLGLLGGENGLNAQKVEKGDVTMEYKIPQSMAFGTSVKVFPNLKVNFDLKWINYSVWDSLDFKFDKKVDFLNVASVIETIAGENDSDPNELRMPRGYEDAWSFALGTEYQYDDTTVLRFGFEPRTSVIPKDRVDFLLPITSANLFSMGGGYQMDKFSRVDVALGYMVSSFDADSGQSVNSNGNKSGDVVYNPYSRLSFEAKTTAILMAASYEQKF